MDAFSLGQHSTTPPYDGAGSAVRACGCHGVAYFYHRLPLYFDGTTVVRVDPANNVWTAFFAMVTYACVTIACSYNPWHVFRPPLVQGHRSAGDSHGSPCYRNSAPTRHIHGPTRYNIGGGPRRDVDVDIPGQIQVKGRDSPV